MKAMEKQKRIDNGDDDTMSDNDDDDLIEHTTFAVEIEVEKMLSETDEDEEEEDPMQIVSASKKMSAGSKTTSPSKIDEPMTAL